MNSMHKTPLIVLFLLSSIFGALMAQMTPPNSELPGQDGKDTSITVPFEYYNTLDNLLHTWVVQRSTVSDCNSAEIPQNISDSVYRLRLSKMPCVMEMPFNSTVRSFIELYTVRKRRLVEYMLGMGEYYFPIFEQVLGANKLPLELRYLPVIESALNATAVSRMGAAGLWQFMPATGRMYGLEINALIDERLDPVKSTHAAVRFMRDLYSMYGDWHLVIAAYNCGPGNVNKAIRRSGGKRDYWEIYPYLPAETRGYVPIFIAATYAMHYADKHNLCKANVQMPTISDTIVVRRGMHLAQISKALDLPLEHIKLLNPQFRKDYIPGDVKPYVLNLPLNYANGFYDKFDYIVSLENDSVIQAQIAQIDRRVKEKPMTSSNSKHKYHKVQRGQSLGSIAARYGVSVTKLKQWNGLRSNLIKPGQRLKILS